MENKQELQQRKPEVRDGESDAKPGDNSPTCGLRELPRSNRTSKSRSKSSEAKELLRVPLRSGLTQESLLFLSSFQDFEDQESREARHCVVTFTITRTAPIASFPWGALNSGPSGRIRALDGLNTWFGEIVQV